MKSKKLSFLLLLVAVMGLTSCDKIKEYKSNMPAPIQKLMEIIGWGDETVIVEEDEDNIENEEVVTIVDVFEEDEQEIISDTYPMEYEKGENKIRYDDNTSDKTPDKTSNKNSEKTSVTTEFLGSDDLDKFEHVKEQIYNNVEQPAEFPGGQAALMSWLISNIRYPEEAHANNIQGRVIVQFVVEKDGSIGQASIAKGVDRDLDKEALRVVKKMPKWQPGKNNGVAVRSYFTLPVTFKIAN